MVHTAQSKYLINAAEGTPTTPIFLDTSGACFFWVESIQWSWSTGLPASLSKSTLSRQSRYRDLGTALLLAQWPLYEVTLRNSWTNGIKREACFCFKLFEVCAHTKTSISSQKACYGKAMQGIQINLSLNSVFPHTFGRFLSYVTSV